MNTTGRLTVVCAWLVSFVGCAAQTPSQQYAQFVIDQCDRIEHDMPRYVQVAERMADLYEQGAAIHFPWNGHGLQQDLAGRAGGLMYLAERSKGQKPEGSDVPDMAIISWDRAPSGNDLKSLKDLDEKGCYILGFGPAAHPELTEHVKLCDEMFDTGFGADGGAIQLADGTNTGLANHVVNALNGWVVIGEMVSAMTRRGQMPKMWKPYVLPGGREWGEKYYGKGGRFHDDMQIEPVPAGQVGTAYVQRIRELTRQFKRTQQGSVTEAADLIAQEMAAGRKTVIATSGHMPWTFVGKFDDAAWAQPFDMHESVQNQVDAYRAKSPRDALVLRLGYFGMHKDGPPLFRELNQRVIMITAEHPGEDHQLPDDLLVVIDMCMAYGDTCVVIEGYPIKLLAPSGIMQAVAYESVNVEVQARLRNALSVAE